MECEQNIPTRLTKAQTRELELRISFLYSRKRTGEIAELRKRATEGTTASVAYTTASCAKRAQKLRKRKNKKPNKTKASKIPKKTKTIPTSTYTEEMTTSTEDHLRLLSTCRSEMGYIDTDLQKPPSFASNVDCFDKESTEQTLAECNFTTEEQQLLDFYKTDFQQFAFPKQCITEAQTDIPTEEKQCKNPSAQEVTPDQGTTDGHEALNVEHTTDQIVQFTMKDQKNENVEHTSDQFVQDIINDQNKINVEYTTDTKREVGGTETPHMSAKEVEKMEIRCENRPNEKRRPNDVSNTSIIENVGFENDETCPATVTMGDNSGMTGDVKQNRRWWSCLVCGTGTEKAKQNKTTAGRKGLLQRILNLFRG